MTEICYVRQGSAIVTHMTNKGRNWSVPSEMPDLIFEEGQG